MLTAIRARWPGVFLIALMTMALSLLSTEARAQAGPSSSVPFDTGVLELHDNFDVALPMPIDPPAGATGFTVQAWVEVGIHVTTENRGREATTYYSTMTRVVLNIGGAIAQYDHQMCSFDGLAGSDGIPWSGADMRTLSSRTQLPIVYPWHEPIEQWTPILQVAIPIYGVNDWWGEQAWPYPWVTNYECLTVRVHGQVLFS